MVAGAVWGDGGTAAVTGTSLVTTGVVSAEPVPDGSEGTGPPVEAAGSAEVGVTAGAPRVLGEPAGVLSALAAVVSALAAVVRGLAAVVRGLAAVVRGLAEAGPDDRLPDVPSSAPEELVGTVTAAELPAGAAAPVTAPVGAEPGAEVPGAEVPGTEGPGTDVLGSAIVPPGNWMSPSAPPAAPVENLPVPTAVMPLSATL